MTKKSKKTLDLYSWHCVWVNFSKKLFKRNWAPTLRHHSMLGFRLHVAAQEIFLLLKEEVLNPEIGSTDRFVLALDIKKAFDITSHETILEELHIRWGEKTYNYITSFLTNRTATIDTSLTQSTLTPISNRETPQGSILPLLFNVEMRNLALMLEEEPELGQATYVDEILLWASNDSIGEKQDILQQAIDKPIKFIRLQRTLQTEFAEHGLNWKRHSQFRMRYFCTLWRWLQQADMKWNHGINHHKNFEIIFFRPAR